MVRNCKAFVPIEGTNQMLPAYAFEYEGELVLVATWLVASDGSHKAPELVVPLRSVAYQKDPAGPDILVSPLPAALFAEVRDTTIDKAYGVFRVRSASLDRLSDEGSA